MISWIYWLNEIYKPVKFFVIIWPLVLSVVYTNERVSICFIFSYLHWVWCMDAYMCLFVWVWHTDVYMSLFVWVWQWSDQRAATSFSECPSVAQVAFSSQADGGGARTRQTGERTGQLHNWNTCLPKMQEMHALKQAFYFLVWGNHKATKHFSSPDCTCFFFLLCIYIYSTLDIFTMLFLGMWPWNNSRYFMVLFDAVLCKLITLVVAVKISRVE